MKNGKFMSGLCLILIIWNVYLLGSQWTLNEIHEAEGELVLPLFQLSLGGIVRKEIRVVIEGKDAIPFHVPGTQVFDLLKDEKNFDSQLKPARAKVAFQKNIWGQTVNPYLTVVVPGWIRRSK